MHPQLLREALLAHALSLTVCSNVAPDCALEISFHGRLSLAGVLLVSLQTYE
jgi:hypothetical protein